jgi:tetratricopeptide (TPR) repeat protein
VQAQAQFRLGEVASAQATIAALLRMRLAGPTRRRMQGNAELLQGLLARQQGNFPQALLHYRNAQTHFVAAQDLRGQGQALQALGVLYTDTTDTENAQRYLNLAAEIYQGDPVYNLNLNNNLGVAAVNSLNPAAAVRYFSRAATIADQLGVANYAAMSRGNMAIAQVDLDRFADAAATLRLIGPLESLPNGPLRVDVTRTHALLALRTAGPSIDPATSLLIWCTRPLADTVTPLHTSKRHGGSKKRAPASSRRTGQRCLPPNSAMTRKMRALTG